MANYRNMVNGPLRADSLEQKVLVCQALIKCADISNPVSYLIHELGLSSPHHPYRADRIQYRNIGQLL